MKTTSLFPSSRNGKQIDVPWRISEAVFAFLMGLGLSSLPMLFFEEKAVNPLGIELLAYVLQIAGFALIPLLLVHKVYRLPASALGIKRPCGRELLFVGCFGGLFLYLLNMLLSTLMVMILPESWVQEQSVVLLLDLAATPVEMLMLVILILVFAPLAEELLFRAFLYPALCKRIGEKRAILLGAAVFAALHLNVVAFLPLFAGGLGFNYMYAKHQNLFYNVSAHMLWNGLSLVLYFIS